MNDGRKKQVPNIKVTREYNREKRIQFYVFLIELALEQEKKEAAQNANTC